jgi:hypothetical protein
MAKTKNVMMDNQKKAQPDMKLPLKHAKGNSNL